MIASLQSGSSPKASQSVPSFPTTSDVNFKVLNLGIRSFCSDPAEANLYHDEYQEQVETKVGSLRPPKPLRTLRQAWYATHRIDLCSNTEALLTHDDR